MIRGRFNRMAAAFAGGLMLASAVAGAARAQQDACPVRAEFYDMGAALPHTMVALYAKRALKVVAIGSSSTAGAGATSPDRAYPAQLERLLAQAFGHARVQVINRGTGGEDTAEMSARLERDVLAERPDLVILQAGTNTILRRQDVTQAADTIDAMVVRIRSAGADVILMDSQFAPMVNEAPGLGAMSARVAGIARARGVGLFRRYGLMEAWAHKDGVPVARFITADRLHMTDWGYACVAATLRHSIADAVAPSAMAGLWP